MKRFAIVFFICSSFTWGAVNATMQWDVRATGSDLNSGGFDPGVASPGTNESQGNSGTAMTITSAGTTGTCSPACTSTTHGPGNTFIIASGAGCSTGIYEIISQAAGTVTFDRSTGAGTCVGVMGGSMLTITTALNQALIGNAVWIKSGTYTVTVGITSSQNVTTIDITGYGTTQGDNGTCPSITTSTNSINLFTVSSLSTWKLTNLCLSSTAASPGIGLNASPSNTTWLDNVSLIGFGTCLNAGSVGVIKVTGNSLIKNCTATGIQYGFANGYLGFENSTIDNALTGILASSNLIMRVQGSTFKNMNTCITSSTSFDIQGNTFYGCSVVALKLLSSTKLTRVFSNVFYNNLCGVDIESVPYGGVNASSFGLNAFGNNTNNGCGAVGYTLQTSDKTLSVDPFVNAAGGDFTPNSTAGGGATLKGAGFPTNVDIGGVQSAAGSGAPQSTVYGQ